MSDETKYIDIGEFVELGFLQEVNRAFLHPLGLALTVNQPTEEGESWSIVGIQDWRDDPEGMAFGYEDDDGHFVPWNRMPIDEVIEKAKKVEAERAKHVQARMALLNGKIVQELPAQEGTGHT